MVVKEGRLAHQSQAVGVLGAEAAGEPGPRRAVGNRDECFGVGRGVDRNSVL